MRLHTDAHVEHSRSVLRNHVRVGFDLTADHDLAEPERGLDHDAVTSPGRRIGREHHATSLGVDHLLYDNCDRGLVDNAPGTPIRHDARPEQRDPAVDDAIDDGVGAHGVRERAVHARERRSRRVLGGCRGAHRDAIRAKPLVRGHDLAPQPLRHAGLADKVLHARRRGVEGRRIVEVQGGFDGDEVAPYAAALHRVEIGVGSDDEARRNGQACARQLAEVCTLAADAGDIGRSESSSSHAIASITPPIGSRDTDQCCLRELWRAPRVYAAFEQLRGCKQR